MTVFGRTWRSATSRLRLRRELRAWDRHYMQHLRETDLRENQRLAASFQEHPVRFVALIIGDVFIDTDISRLKSHVLSLLGPDRAGREDRARVKEMLSAAESKAGGRMGLAAIQFESKAARGGSRFGQPHLFELPPSVPTASLLLNQFAPGMVMAVAVIAGEPDLAEHIFQAHHPTPIQHLRGGGISFGMVDAAMSADLEQHLRAMATLRLIPSRRGLLGKRRFSDGAIAVWSTDELPDREDESWRDVCRVLGFGDWFWWGDSDRRIYDGMPGRDRRFDSERGRTMIFRGWRDVDPAMGTPERVLRFSIEDELGDWFPLVLLNIIALRLGEQAGRLRQRLSRRATALGWRSVIGPGYLVRELGELQYQLERIRQAADVDGGRREFGQFPLMLGSETPAIPITPATTSARRLIEWWRRKAAPPARPSNLRDAALGGVDRLTREGLHDVRLSLDRARLLADIRSSNGILGLTFALVLLAAVQLAGPGSLHLLEGALQSILRTIASDALTMVHVIRGS